MPKKPRYLSWLSWKKLVRPLVVVGGLVFIVGVAYAYFTSQDVSADLVFKTGSLKINLIDPAQLDFSNLMPGDKRTVDYSVKNTGTVPVNLKGKFSGAWSDETLDNSKLAPVKLEYQADDGNWVSLVENGPSYETEYFYANENNQSQLFELAPEATVNWRVTFQLAEDVADEYQNQEFKVKLHMAAKQTQAEATWPESY